MENPIKMDDLGVPPFKETPISPKTHHHLFVGTSSLRALGQPQPGRFSNTRSPRSLTRLEPELRLSWGSLGILQPHRR